MAALVAVGGCSTVCVECVPPPAAGSDDYITLSVPTGTPPALCTALAGATANASYGSSNLVLQGMRRTFFDDFDTLDFSWSRWRPHYDGGWDPVGQKWLGYDWMVKRTLQGNQEQEIYVDPGYKGSTSRALGLNPFALNDGKLEIIADRTPAHLRSALYGYEFTSGLLTSRASLVQKYGFFEMRAKMPRGKALWPAFWLLSEDKSWPPEIDVFEVVGQKPEVIASAIHWKNSFGAHKSSGCRTTVATAATEYHQYGVLWDEQRVVYYIDRVPVAQIATPPGLTQRMYMLMNLAVGGNFVGVADEETPTPSVFSIDWVAAYTKSL